MRKVIVLFFIVVFLNKPAESFAQVNVQDSLALVDLYDSTFGENWGNHSGWLTGPVPTWYGIAVSNNRVTSIKLGRNGLSGTIPASTGNLSALDTLDLNSDWYVVSSTETSFLGGPIPASLGQLSNLEYLNLSEDAMTGSIPSSLGNLTNLKFLYLGYISSLSGSIPSSFGQLTSLVDLNIEGCQISGPLPAGLLNLPNLQYVDLWDNQISGNVPPIVIHNSNLKVLYLGTNDLSGSIPSSLSYLSNLNVLDLSDNKLSDSIPSSLGQLSNLAALYLFENQLSDSIPSTLTQLNNITTIWLSNNEFTFAGMEGISIKFGNNETNYSKKWDSYDYQATIPINFRQGKLSVSVGGNPANETFNWSKDGALYKTIVGDPVLPVTENGNYSVTVTDSVAPELTLYSYTIYANNLQVTTTYANETCGNKNGSIYATGVGGTPPYQFSINGEPFASSSVFAALSAGIYTITVEDATDSTSSIEDTLTDTPLPAVSLGKDTTLCTGQSLILEAPAGTGYEYLWQDRSTAEDYTVSSAGTYWVKVTNEYGCSAADTIDVSFLVFPALSLGNDTTLCNGEALDLKISIPQAVYLWNTGSTASALSISTAGLYWVNVSEGGCEERDSINVSFKPSPTISLGDDTTLCEGQSLVLNAANNNATYLWQDGSTEPTYTVTAEGSYSVIVALDDGCDTSGKVMVDYIGKPVVNLGGDTSLCGSEKLVLDASSPQASYLWQDGSTGADLTVTQAGTYAVQVSNSCGSVVDSIAVQYGVCTCKFYVPSAFTPNGDGRNDVFRPVSKCVPAGYAFRVYDRWGMVVFNSKNSGEAWDGNVHGKLQPNGTYVWELAYVDTITGKAVKMNGTVVLVR